MDIPGYSDFVKIFKDSFEVTTECTPFEHLQRWRTNIVPIDRITRLIESGYSIITNDILDVIGGLWQEKVLAFPLVGMDKSMRRAPRLGTGHYPVEEPERTIYGREGLKCHKVVQDIPVIT